jgi:hypothetical protein
VKPRWLFWRNDTLNTSDDKEVPLLLRLRTRRIGRHVGVGGDAARLARRGLAVVDRVGTARAGLSPWFR